MLAYISRRFLPSVLAVLCLPAAARAWTDTQVSAASAQLDLTQPGLAKVELTVGLRVSGGWLSQFELLDLDADLEPTEPATAFEAADGSMLLPTLSRPKPGSVVFEFADRRTAPKRGDYKLHFSYLTRAPFAAAAGTSARGIATWSMPRWPTQLQNVQVRVLAPSGSRIAHFPEREHYGDQFATQARGNGLSELSFTRLELPRTESFTIGFELPRAPTALQAALPGVPVPEPAACWIAMGFVLVLLSKRRLTRRSCAQQGLVAHALVPFWPSFALGCVLCALAIAYFELSPLPAAVSGVLGSVLTLDRALLVANRSLAAIRSGTHAQLERAEHLRWPSRLEPSFWLDITTPIGCAVALALFGLLALVHAQAPAAVGCGAMLLVPVLCSATRASRPHCAWTALDKLAELQTSLRVPSLLVVHDDSRGLAVDARLRIQTLPLLEIGFAQDAFGRSGPRYAFICQLDAAAATTLQASEPAWRMLTSAAPNSRTLLRSCARPARELSQVLARLASLAGDRTTRVSAPEAEPRTHTQRSAA